MERARALARLIEEAPPLNEAALHIGGEVFGFSPQLQLLLLGICVMTDTGRLAEAVLVSLAAFPARRSARDESENPPR